ncbi:MAG: neutral zinc metallopeptidase [Chloroflexota bacterium]|nr:neutral zinc metallopeptidase [Chloroflexota bacterium]
MSHPPYQRSGALHRFAIVVMVAILTITAAPIALAQESGDDRVASVTSALQELSRLEESGEVGSVYDRMLPDARNIFPRQSMFDWFEAGDAPIAADDAARIDVSFEDDWTSELTGEDYDEVARVTFRQRVTVDGEERDEDRERYFVNDGARWRWLPEISEDRLDALVSELDDNVTYESPFRQEFYLDLDTFWAGVFEQEGVAYEPPDDVVAVEDEPIETGCGVERDIDEVAIYYCSIDETIYYSPEFQELVIDFTGPYGWDHIIAHEWGHHIQDLLGIEVTRDPELDDGYYVIEIERLADCLAGVYTQDALARGEIEQGDIRDAEKITLESGDLADVTWDDPAAHGTGEQRVQSLQTGFEDGFLGCNLDVADLGA